MPPVTTTARNRTDRQEPNTPPERTLSREPRLGGALSFKDTWYLTFPINLALKKLPIKQIIASSIRGFPRGRLKQKPSLKILAAGLSALNGMAVVAIALLYLSNPTSLQGLIQIEVMAGLSIASVLYYFSLHRLLLKLHEGLSTLVLAVVTILNLILAISQTGGLDSPLYALWLLVIVCSGLFGPIFTLAIIVITILAHLAATIQHGFAGAYIGAHLVQLLISLVAAALAEWVYYRGSLSHDQASSLSGMLNQEQLKAQALMSSMADGVIVVDSARRIQLINKAAQELTGWDETSAQNIDYRLILKLKNSRGEDITDANDPFSESWNKRNSVVHNDLSATTRNGKNIELTVSIAPIYDNDQITGGIAVFRDISREKEVERSRNEFVSTASHEMRTPVAAIEGYISLAMNSKVATIDDRAKNYLEKAHDNTQHLGALFRDLLSVTKLDEGLIARNRVPVNLTKMLQDITNDMQFAAGKKSLTITFMPSAQYGPKMLVPSYWVSVDAERMREVIMNLIDNGMKFTHEGGIAIGINGDDNSITVAIKDTGIGIPQEDIPHLFQKFYRVDNSATRTIGGTGLGLYLVRTLIELFGGRIWIESEFGKGTTFYFTLPRIKEPETSVEMEAQPEAAPASAIPAPNPPPAPAPAPNLIPIATALSSEPSAPIANPVPPIAPAAPPAPTPIPPPVRPSLTDIRPVAVPAYQPSVPVGEPAVQTPVAP